MTPLMNGKPTLIATLASTAQIFLDHGAVCHALAIASVSEGASSAALWGCGDWSSSSSLSCPCEDVRRGEGGGEGEEEEEEERRRRGGA